MRRDKSKSGGAGSSLIMVAGLFLLTGWPLNAAAQSGRSLRPGKVVLQGSYPKKKLREGRRQVTFYYVQSGKSLLLRVGGPAALVLQARGKNNHSATLRFSLDGKKGAEEAVELGSRTSVGFYIKVPAGTHHLEVRAPTAVMFRPVKVRRGPMGGERVVVFRSLSPPAESRITAATMPASGESPTGDELPPLPPLKPPVDNKPVVKKKPPDSPIPVAPGKSTPPPVSHQSVQVRTIEARMVSESGDSESAKKPAAAESTPVTPVEPLHASSLGLHLVLAIGGGAVDQTYTHNQQTFNLSAGLGWRIVKGIVLDLCYHSRFGWQQYLSRNPDAVSLEPQLVTVREQFWDIGLGASFDLLRNKWYRVLSALGLEVSLAPQFLALANDVFGSWAGGIRLGLKLDGSLAKELHLAVWGGWLVPFVGSQNDITLAGGARHFWDYGLGLRWIFSGRKPFRSWSVELGWRGNTIIFEHASRTYNAAVLCLATEL